MDRDPRLRSFYRGLTVIVVALGAVALPADAAPQNIGVRGLIETGAFEDIIESYDDTEAQLFGIGLTMSCDPEVVEDPRFEAAEEALFNASYDDPSAFAAWQEGYNQGQSVSDQDRC